MYRPINQLMRWLSERGPVLIVAPWCDHFGDICETMHFGLVRARMDGKKVLFLFPRWKLFGKLRQARAYNPVLFDLRSPLRFLSWSHPLVQSLGVLLSLFYGSMKVSYLMLRKIRRGLEVLVPGYRQPVFDPCYLGPIIGRDSVFVPNGVRRFDWDSLNVESWRRGLAENVPVDLAPEDIVEAEGVRRRMGLPKDAEFVCLHVREGSTYRDSAVYSARNADIMNYLPAVEEITRRGIWVVRIGDPSMKPLPPLERVIDYVHSPWHGPLMNIYLLSRCLFQIASDSGPVCGALLFGRRVLLVNFVEPNVNYPFRRGDLGIYKRVRTIRDGRYLSLRETLALPFHWDKKTFFWEENSPEEILLAVREFLRRSPEAPRSALQQDFHDARLASTRSWMHDYTRSLPSPFQQLTETYRNALIASWGGGAVCQFFLERHWNAEGEAGALAGVPRPEISDQ